jgi:hypothetical protein
VEVGTFVANSTPVFCPLYLRNPLMDGDMFEDMMLDMWSRSGVSGQLVYSGGNLVTNSVTRTAIMSKDATGAFVVEVDFADVIQNADNQFIRLHLDQNIVKSMRQNGFSAKLRFKLFPTSSGYKTMSNERYVTVESEVMYGSALDRKYVNVNESIILYTTTVKDFAIFMMYPETVSGVLSNKSSLTMNLGGPSSKIYGRVFFNGDIDTPLENLPEFNELVIISGNLIVNGKTFDQARTLIAKKFKKGLVVRFPVKRLVNDGECIAGLKTANQSGMFCKDNLNPAVNADTSTYIRNLGNICSGLKVTYKSGDFTYDYTGVVNPIIKEQCKGSEPEHVILSGGSTTVNVTGSYAFIVSPVKTLISGSATNIYGTIFGGHLETKDGSRFYSLSALRKGLPGIASDADLSAISSEAERVSAGVGVALLNLPLVRQATNGK